MTFSCKLHLRSRISRAKFHQILRLFALDLTAIQIALITNLNRMRLKECEFDLIIVSQIYTKSC